MFACCSGERVSSILPKLHPHFSSSRTVWGDVTIGSGVVVVVVVVVDVVDVTL